MADKVILKTPVMVICYGKVDQSNRRLFAVSESSGAYMLPVFTDWDLAERYRKQHNDAMKAEVLPFRVAGADSPDLMPDELKLYMVEKAEHLTDMLTLAHMAVGMTYVAINPQPGATALCYQLDELSIES